MNMGCRPPFEIRSLHAFCFFVCFFLCLCLCVFVFFFSLLETQKPKTPVSCRGWWRGGEKQAEIPGVPAVVGSRARQVMMPAGCHTEGVAGAGQVERALF